MDESTTYVINLLPEDLTLKHLNRIKNYFNVNDFKFERKLSTADCHIKLSEFSKPDSWATFRKDLVGMIQEFSTLKVTVRQVTDDIKHTEKNQKDEGWVALIFNDESLKKIFNKLNTYLVDKKISLNSEYVESIKKLCGQKLDTFDYIANHLNLCNHCKPEKAKEAKNISRIMCPERLCLIKLLLKVKTIGKEYLSALSLT